MDAKPKTCANCGSAELYSKRVQSGGSHGPYLLEGLGGFMHYAEFEVVVCADCGLTQFFAEKDARQKLKDGAAWWKQVNGARAG